MHGALYAAHDTPCALTQRPCSLFLSLATLPYPLGRCISGTHLACNIPLQKPPNTSHANTPAAPYPSIVQRLPRRLPHPVRDIPSPRAIQKQTRRRIPKARRLASYLCLAPFSPMQDYYTNPAKPMKAMAKMPAVTSATGTPRMACGTSFSSSRSRMPAKTVSARAKPSAVETA